MLSLKEFLRIEVVPALGCTEPGAVALAAARARCELWPDAEITRVVVRVSESIYKNGMDVGIPGAMGGRGNALAAALGAIAGKAGCSLEALRDCSPADVDIAKSWLAQGKVDLSCVPGVQGVYVECTIETKDHRATCVISQSHSHIERVTLDGRVVFDGNAGGQPAPGGDGAVSVDPEPSAEIEAEMRTMTFESVMSLAEDMDLDDVDYIMSGVEMNKAIAEYGLRDESVSGLGLGRAVLSMIRDKRLENDLMFRIRSYASAASDARMAGAKMPAMSAVGSGNQGIAAILPVALLGEALGKSRVDIARGVAMSVLTTSFIRARTGRLAPICGSAVAAGAGAAVGMTWLMGGTIDQAANAMRTMLSATAGIVCDGAKGSCALRIGSVASEAYLAALMALKDKGVTIPQGVVDDSLEITTDNLGILNKDGMKDVDAVIIRILEARGKYASMSRTRVTGVNADEEDHK
ncbi:MAG: L-serine ammonia-lyase, iron-sulfur-dependent, subunit alpha [Firmicutes bacterium]|jgi:L-cysteine desulfidase|nr:L-serine ammonia-lyase, iron-sulfur-dependent, subunit alpha [Bacillota bacterium]